MQAGVGMKRRGRRAVTRLSIVMLVTGLLSAGPALAASCYALNAPKITFSHYQPLNDYPEDIDATIDFYCEPAFRDNQLSVRISVPGPGSGQAMLMKNEHGESIRYGIFFDPARSIPLDADRLIPVRDINVEQKTFRVVLYGRIFSHQRNAGAGHYQSNITLLLDY